MALAVDGTATTGAYAGTATKATGTLTTAHTNDIIIAAAWVEANLNGGVGTIASVTATGLTFVSRKGAFDATGNDQLSVWYATAASTFSGAITFHIDFNGASSAVDSMSGIAFGISGANTSTPWDTNASLTAVGSGSTLHPTVSGISTSNANDMVLGIYGWGSTGTFAPTTLTAGSGLTVIASSADGGGTIVQAEFITVSATQSSLSMAWTGSTAGADDWVMFGDAIQAAAGAPAIIPPPKRRIVPVRSLRWI